MSQSEIAPGTKPTLEAAGDYIKKVREATVGRSLEAIENLEWLKNNMPAYFFITMREETEALLNLVQSLRQVPGQVKVNLLEEPQKLIVALEDLPGSLYETLKALRDQPISYAEMTHSSGAIPGGANDLEVQRFEFKVKSPVEIAQAGPPRLPKGLLRPVSAAMSVLYPDFDLSELKDLLWLLWLNNPDYVLVSPPERLARILRVHQQGKRHGGLFLDIETIKAGDEQARLVFAVGNPPHAGYLAQTMEVFKRLNLAVRRLYALNVTTRHHGYFLGNFYVTTRDKAPLEKKSERFVQLKTELYNTQILSPQSEAYRVFLSGGLMTGRDSPGQRLYRILPHLPGPQPAGPFLSGGGPGRFRSPTGHDPPSDKPFPDQVRTRDQGQKSAV